MSFGYSETLIRYASDTIYVGLLDSPDGIGEAGLTGPGVGSRLAARFTLKVRAGHLDRVKVQVFGCGFTIAACVAAAELAQGRAIEDAEKLCPAAINRVLDDGLPAERAYCAELACSALRAALQSFRRNGACISVEQSSGLAIAADQGPRISSDDPLLQHLMQAAERVSRPEDDRRMFAGVLTLASREQAGLPETAGLSAPAFDELLRRYFPGCASSLFAAQVRAEEPVFSVRPDPELVALLHTYVPRGRNASEEQSARWLADIIAVRCGQPGHLWVAMGFAKRADLSAAIRRHLPALAAANNRGMRWKRFLFKQLCEARGGVLCKAPNCGECSDYSLCFADD